jgi:hypothetical protein
MIKGTTKKKTKKKCMPLCYCPKSYISKLVSIRSKAIGEKEANKANIRGHEKKGDYEGEVYKK